MSVLNRSGKSHPRLVMILVIMLSWVCSISASPQDWVLQDQNGSLSAWNFYSDVQVGDQSLTPEPPVVALSCIPQVNVSLNQDGFAVITPVMLVNAPDYPLDDYSVDIMGPLTNTVSCENIGEELMAVVTELPTGNSCMSVLNVEDKLAPELTCEPDVLPCNTDIPSIDFENYLEEVDDNCDSDVELWYSFVSQNLPCNPDNYTKQVLVTWTATDDYGNSSTCVDTIFLLKPDIGQIDFPPDVSISCIDADTDPSNTGEPTYMGEPIDHACQYVNFHSDVIIPMCDPAYKIRRTWTVMDWCTGSTATDVQEILVVDDNKPNITCPPNVTLSTDFQVCTTKYTLPMPVVSDPCADAEDIDVTITIAANPPIPGIYVPGQMINLNLGTSLITMRATDPCGNTRICQYNVTVEDDLPPIIACPGDVTIQCEGLTDPGETGFPIVIDICDDDPDVSYEDITLATDGCGLGYIIMRTWTAEDESGNVATCMQMIELNDDMAPTITCPDDITISCEDVTLPANTGMATATDECDPSPDVDYEDVTVQGSCTHEYFINRTWSATDDCDNVGTCLQVIHVMDLTPPDIMCPDDITIMCIESSDPSETGTAVATDICDENPGVSYADVTISGFQEITIERTWTATDDCGNTSTCLQIILVRDETPPDIVCPPDTTIECGDPTDPGDTGVATSTDNCDDNPIETWNDVTISGSCDQEYTIERTWTAEDECGNTATCLQIITIVDSTPPIITCPASITIECSDSSLPGNTGSASSTDNCDSAPVVGYNDITIAGSCPQAYTINRVWNATDDCGNSSTCVQTITVEDSTPPVITCPANTTIECDESSAPANTGSASANDNCDSSPDIDFSDAVAPGACPQESTITRTWTATDGCGNSSTCQQIIVVEDTTPPVITFCAANVTIECDESTLPGNTGTTTASDNCDPAPVVNFEDVTTSGPCPLAYVITRTWTATDACGNATNCIQIITVDDTTPPVITCPANVTIECDESSDPGSTGTATAVDNCDDDPVINFSDATSPGACPNELTISRTWTATDACGNSSTCVQTIVVDDSTPPVITCPANTTVECTESTDPAETGFATASDNCTTAPIVDFSDVTTAGACPQEYTITRTWSATDNCGNVSTCNQIITVDDSTPPVISCPADVTIACEDSTDPANTGSATASDSCDDSPVISFEDNMASGDCANESTIERTWTATDACGNESTCIQLISISDDEAPTISCPVDVTIGCSESTLPANTGEASATDNCDDAPEVTFSDVTVGGDCPLLLTITRTWTATDDCGNTSSCVQTIIVTDTDAPAITCPADITIECDESTDPANTGFATGSDECSDPEITFEDAFEGSGCAQESFIFRTWTATDECGQTSTCVQLISIVDTTSPIISCPPDVTVQCDDSTSPDDTGVATAVDNCDDEPIVNFSDVTTGAGCPDGYIITRTWTATDRCGNVSTCEQTILVDDNIAPIIGCPGNVSVECLDSTSPDNTGSASATDVCDASPDIEFSDAIVDSACPEVFTINRTWIATDNCGNSSTCLQVIEVEDNIAPICVPEDITVELGPDNTITILASDVDGGSSDACGGPVTLSVSPSSFDCNTLGPNPVVLTVTDCSGNSSTCDATVTVEDNNNLVASCQNITIFLDENGNASIDPEDIDNGSGGGCVPGDITLELDQTEFDCTPLGGIQVTLTVTDEDGNTATCTAIVTVLDTISPTIMCPDNLTINCNESTDPSDTGMATGSDNCPPAIITFTDVDDLNDCGVGTIMRTWVATDASGNATSCTQTIVVDNLTPFDEDAITWPDEEVDVDICDSTHPSNTGVPMFDPRI